MLPLILEFTTLPHVMVPVAHLLQITALVVFTYFLGQYSRTARQIRWGSCNASQQSRAVHARHLCNLHPSFQIQAQRSANILLIWYLHCYERKTFRYYPRCGQLLGQLVCETDDVLFACQEPIGLMGPLPFSILHQLKTVTGTRLY